MNLKELVSKLSQDNLMAIHADTEVKEYVSGDVVMVNGKWKNMTNVYGIYRGEDGKYCVFITDSERGIPEYSKICDTEENACNVLYDKISRIERIYLKSLK